MQGGASGDIYNNTGITLTDGYSPPTNSNTGMTYGAWSNTTSPQNNYGIRLIAGPGAYTGSIETALDSSITVNGNNSYGISIEAPLVADGNLTEPTWWTAPGRRPDDRDRDERHDHRVRQQLRRHQHRRARRHAGGDTATSGSRTPSPPPA